MRALSQRGQASIEYVGVLIAAALLVLVLITSGIGAKVAGGIEDAVCSVIPGAQCHHAAPQDPNRPVNPHLSPEEIAQLGGDPKDAQGVLESLSPQERRWLQRNDPQTYQGVLKAQDWHDRNALTERYMHATLDDFFAYRDGGTRDKRLDWSTDECSAPLVGNTGMSFDFTKACIRHDFGYRNTKKLGTFKQNKSAIDSQFYRDMKDHCATRSIFLKAQCYNWATIFYLAVREFGD